MYAPSSVINLSWSERVGGVTCLWDIGPSAAEGVAQTVRTIAVEADAAESVIIPPPGCADNGHVQEARAYGLVLEGDVGAAIEVLGRVCRDDAKYPWERELLA